MPIANPITSMFPEIGNINIVDIGAMALPNEKEPYWQLIESGKASVVGFEPNHEQCAKLNARSNQGRYYPYFIGDGSQRTYYETNFNMTGSLLRPNGELLGKFTHLNELVRVVKEHPVQTRRLDDLTELEGLSDIDLVKTDIQGGELDLFRGAARVLDSAVVVISEVEFVPLYQDQPLFGDIDRHLRECGYQFHTFLGFGSRFFKPFTSPANANAGLRQLLWSDAVFVRDFMHFDRLPDQKLLKLAVILDLVIGSFDLAGVALGEYDRRHGTTYATDYITATIANHRARTRAAS